MEIKKSSQKTEMLFSRSILNFQMALIAEKWLTKIKPKQIIYLLGLYQLARDENGLRELRTILSKRANDRTWYRIVKDMQEAGNIISKNKTRSWVKQIDEAIDEYKAMKFKNLKLKEVKVKQNYMETWIEENSKEHNDRLNKIINS